MFKTSLKDPKDSKDLKDPIDYMKKSILLLLMIMVCMSAVAQGCGARRPCGKQRASAGEGRGRQACL